MCTSASQTLKKKQLVELYKKFECVEWKQNIEKILLDNYLALDDTDIKIEQKYIDLLNEKGSKEHKEAVENYGLKVADKKQLAEELFWELFNGCTVKKESFIEKEDIVYYKNGKWMFCISEALFFYSIERVYPEFTHKFHYSSENINALILEKLRIDLKIMNIMPHAH